MYLNKYTYNYYILIRTQIFRTYEKLNKMRTWYIIKNETTGKYVDIDRASGGYPYDTEIYKAHRFGTPQEAKEYKGVIKPKDNWKLHELLIGSKHCGWENEA